MNDLQLTYVCRQHSLHGGCTYQTHMGDRRGYHVFAVSPFKFKELRVPGSELPFVTLENYVNLNRRVLDDPHFALGTWYDEEHDESVLDLLFLTGYEDEAIAFAVGADQQAYYNLNTETVVFVNDKEPVHA